MADKQISQLVAATTIENDDLFVMQQGGTAKKLSGQKLSDFVYQSAADQIERVNEAVEQTQAAVDYLEEQKNEIAQTIADMAQLGTDTTLSTPGMAADAKATGEVKAVALARFEQKEISGVPIATFDDGADDAPVKKLVANIDPVQDLHGYANPWPAGGGKNICDGVGYDGYISSNIPKIVNNTPVSSPHSTSSAYGGVCFIAPVKSGQTYALSSDATGASASFYWSIYASVADATDNTKSLQSGTTNVSFTANSDGYVVFMRYNAASGTAVTWTYSQVELGSTATAYAPYSNVCPITGWTGANVMRTGKNLWGGEKMADDFVSAINNSSACYKGSDANGNYFALLAGNSINHVLIPSAKQYKENTRYTFVIKARKGNTNSSLNVLVNYTDGTRTVIEFPSDPVVGTVYTFAITTDANKTIRDVKSYWGSNTAYLYYDSCGVFEGILTADDFEPFGTTYSITFPSEAGTVYGGTLDVTKGVLTVDHGWINLGSMSWTFMDSGGIARFLSHDINSLIKHPASNAYSANMISSCYEVTSLNTAIYNRTYAIASYNDGDILIRDARFEDSQMLETALANEILAYELATPITYNLTPTEVRTLLALNNIWADTGNILDLIYRKMPIPAEELENTIESMIAGVEHTMEATQNYTAGDLVIAVHKLYHIDSNIASGETLVPGVNCSVTTIEAELASLKTSVNNLNLALGSFGSLATLNYQVVT